MIQTVPSDVRGYRHAYPVADGATVGSWAFLGVTVASLGGPLALAALYAPKIVAGSAPSAGFVAVAAAVIFGIPLFVWLRYSEHIAGAGGLYSFVEAAAGRRVALVQASLWIISYLLYLVYTTASIVYDTLPAVLPGVRPYRPFLEIAIPVAMAGIMVAGRKIALVVLGALAAAQVVLVGALAAVTIEHDAPVMSFGIHPAGSAIGTGTGMISLLYICGSLPLFLGGEVAHPSRTIRRGMTAGYLLVAAGVTVAVFPLAANPAFTRAEIPGMAVAQVFSGHALAVAVGTGVAASIAGVMMVEYLALSRLLHAITDLPIRSIVIALGIAMVAVAPFSLINPDRFYDSLIRPSLIALWLSQLIVFAVYPRFAVKHGGQRLAAWLLAGGASAIALYGLYATVRHLGS